MRNCPSFRGLFMKLLIAIMKSEPCARMVRFDCAGLERPVATLSPSASPGRASSCQLGPSSSLWARRQPVFLICDTELGHEDLHPEDCFGPNLAYWPGACICFGRA